MNFTGEETDNAIFLRKALKMTDEELIAAYTENMKSRGEGGDLSFDLQMPISILLTVLGQRRLQIPLLPEDHKISGYIKQIDTPDSSSLEGYGFDKYAHCLYVKYNSGDGVYAFPDMDTNRFKKFESSKSKGKEVTLLRKEYAKTKD